MESERSDVAVYVCIDIVVCIDVGTFVCIVVCIVVVGTMKAPHYNLTLPLG